MSFDPRPLFQEADARAELTVATIRLLIAIALLAILFLTVKPGTAAPATGSPWPGVLTSQASIAFFTIGTYFAWGLATLTICLLGRYRGWMAWPFATVDAMIALASLSIGLINNDLNGAYAPLIPASWLLVLVLAFGALRYDPALQIWLAAFISTGLAVIVAVTDGFVDAPTVMASDGTRTIFLTSPPTIMRILMFLAAGMVIALAVWRARRLLSQAIDAAQRRSNLTRYLPRQIAGLLESGDLDALRKGRNAELAILFIDIRGFTSRVEEMDPADLAAFLTRFRGAIARAADAHGGVVDKFVGDGALVIFGLEREREDDASRALSMARALIATTRDLTPEGDLRLAIGAHWGSAFCGVVGDDARLEFTVLGDVVNVAARIESRAKAEDATLVASDAFLRRAGKNTASWRALGHSQIRGRVGAVELFALNEEVIRAAG